MTIAAAKQDKSEFSRSLWVGVLLSVAVPVGAFSSLLLEDVSANNPERRFRLNRQHYVDQIAQLPQTGAPRLAAFDWGSTGGVAVANVFYTLVYDESGEIDRLVEERTMEWRQRACSVSNLRTCFTKKSDPPRYYVDVRKMDTHFYLMRETYQ